MREIERIERERETERGERAEEIDGWDKSSKPQQTIVIDLIKMKAAE